MKKTSRFQFTILGSIASVLAVLVWVITFQPHGGVELSAYLFPVSRLLLQWIYPHESIPPTIWYVSALLHWFFIGASVDIVRYVTRRSV